ncbi:MAG: hypothetical protein KA149_01160 [Chitinophagales bacterium]|nr:hypothetical protein [Chitinophagales bacterium]
MKATTIILSFYLLAVSLAPNFGGYQLLKLPKLVTHFLEHRAENKQMTLTAFLVMHYLSPTVVDADYEHDMQLPFKTEAISLPQGAIALIPISIPDFSFSTFVSVVHKTPVLNDGFVLSLSLCNIWQPPKA